ncbi:hypothetical protein D3C81_1282510 [compost metagenome]
MNDTFVVEAMMHDALVPVTSATRICTALFIEIVQIVRISPFIRFTTTCQAERHPFQFHIAPFFPIKFTSPFIHNISNTDRALVELGTFCTLADSI